MIWLILGIIIGASLLYLIMGVRNKKFEIAWYQWVLGIISVSMLLFTIQNYFGLRREIEDSAANFILMSVGLPALVLGALIWIIPMIIKSMKRKDSHKGIPT